VLARPSGASLFLELRKAGVAIGTATGFIVERESKRYLVTNRHVVRGINVAPDVLVVAQHVAGHVGMWQPREEQLYDKTGQPQWFEHPSNPAEVDVAAFPLRNDTGIDVYGYDPWSPGPGLKAGVSEPLNIIGFPFGITGGGALGIWVRGFVATEPGLDWQNLPRFLIDSRTRSGQSGSPVIAYSNGGAVPMADGSLAFMSGPVEQFFGVYSGRINQESDLGIVWKAQVVRDVIEGKKKAVV
jgi:Trypsin-like peptidase domain